MKIELEKIKTPIFLMECFLILISTNINAIYKELRDDDDDDFQISIFCIFDFLKFYILIN